MWGDPAEMGVFKNTYGSDTPFWFVALVWNDGSDILTLRYTPPGTISEAAAAKNHAVPISIMIHDDGSGTAGALDEIGLACWFPFKSASPGDQSGCGSST